MPTAANFIATAKRNPINTELLQRLATLQLPQCLLTAGCLFQAVWNQQAGLPPAWGVKDYDIFYFDADTSWAAENAVIETVQALCGELGVTLEVKNQARVHLWYGQRFGRDYPALRSANDGVDRYLVAGTCVAIEVASGEVYAPFGLGDIYNGVLRSNPINHQPDLFLAKARSYQQRWPLLQIIEG